MQRFEDAGSEVMNKELEDVEVQIKESEEMYRVSQKKCPLLWDVISYSKCEKCLSLLLFLKSSLNSLLENVQEYCFT